MWGQSVIRRKNSRTAIEQAARFAIEGLEPRVMLSVAWAAIKAEPAGNTLHICSTNQADVIELGINANDSNLIDVNLNGREYQFSKAGIEHILIRTWDGNDRVTVNEDHGLLPVGITVKAGRGSDRIVGSSLADDIWGAAGNDYLVGNAGDDQIGGHYGNDKMWGGIGHDVIRGAEGHDWLVGGLGDDALFGNAGNDLIDATEGADHADGGIGVNETNTARAVGFYAPLVGNETDFETGLASPATFIATPGGYTVPQIRNAYGFGDLTDAAFTNRGQGQAIAVVIAYHIPLAEQDLAAFSDFYGLPEPITPVEDPITGGNFEVIYAGGTQPLEEPSGLNSWAGEANLDLQWAHAIAPEAKLYLVEADSNSFEDLNTAIDVAARTLVTNHGGGVVNMSLGLNIYQGGEVDSGQTEAIFNNPAYNQVTFVAASGDHGAEPWYPGSSPNVVSVGGTALFIDANGDRTSAELPWNQASGGFSLTYPAPVYQQGLTIDGEPAPDARALPDVSYNGDLATAVSVYMGFESFDQNNDDEPDTGWIDVGGTSAGAPQWAGLIALANQARVNDGLNLLGGGATAKLYALGELNQAQYFNDITTGVIGGPNNINEYEAFPGFDVATGWGTPIADQVIAGLADGSIAGAQIRGGEWTARYTEAFAVFPPGGAGGAPLFARYLGRMTARVTNATVSLVFSIDQQYFGRLLQITMPVLQRDANDQFRGTGTATVVGPFTGSPYKVAIAGRVFTEDGELHVEGTFDGHSLLFPGQLPQDALEPTFHGSFTTNY